MILRIYCHPEPVEGDSHGENVSLQKSHFDPAIAGCDRFWKKEF